MSATLYAALLLLAGIAGVVGICFGLCYLAQNQDSGAHRDHAEDDSFLYAEDNLDLVRRGR